MKIILSFFLTVLLILPPFASAAERATSAGGIPSATPIIGVILPFTSAFTAIAEEQQNAIELAVAEMGDDVEVIYRDGGGDGSTAVAAFEELTAMGRPPVAVISCASWAATAIHPRAADSGVFHIAIGSAVFERTRPGHTVRFTLDVAKEEEQLANYLSLFPRIAILYMDNAYGNNWARNIEKSFPDRVVASMSYDPIRTDFGREIALIKKERPNALVLLSADRAARIAEQARLAGITAQLVGTRPIERPELLKWTRYTEGLVYTYPSSNPNHPFVKAYEKRYGSRPTVFAGEAYDAITTLKEALGETTPAAERLFAWYAGRTYTGALGEVSFAANGDASYPYLYKEVEDGEFRVADFQFPLLLDRTQKEIAAIIRRMDEAVKGAAARLAATGLTGRAATEVLRNLHGGNEYSFDCATIDPQGVIVNVVPQRLAPSVVGQDISGQEQIRRLHESRKPVFSLAIDTVEGFVGFDLEYPVFGEDGAFMGSVSMLTKPDFFGSIIHSKVANFPVEMWMMQTDGRIVYDVNEEEIGRKLFTDEVYARFPSLVEVGRTMAKTKQGRDSYTFLDKKMETRVEKKVLWSTIAVHGTEFRLALSHVDRGR